MNLIYPIFAVTFLSYCQAVDEWDHFVFSQQWPQSICIERNNSHEYHCEIPSNTNSWTVHGIWPTESSSMGPNYCDNETKFDPSLVASILPKLQQYWPNLFTNEDPNSFWKHEWEKHGTCAKSMPALGDELKYFRKGLELQQTYDLLKMLTKQGFSPANDKTYPYAEFEKGFHDALGSQTATLLCYYDKVRQTQYLAEIEFCIDKTFQVMDCPHKHRSSRRSTRAQFNVISMLQKKRINLNDPSPRPCRDSEDIAYPEVHSN